MEDLQLQDTIIFLVAAGLIIPVVKQLRISPVLGFLLVGIAIGPHGLAQWVGEYEWLSVALITDVEGVNALAELGVVFLLFMIGLEMSLERLWAMRRLVLGMGFAQILVTAAVIGGIAWLFGNSGQASLLLGSCLALSSTAVVIQLLVEQGRFGTTVGHGSFAVLLAQDIAVVPILFLVGIFGAHSGGSISVELGLALFQASVAVFAILGVGRLIVRPLLRFVGATDSPELFMATTLLLVIATAAVTHAAGLSAALGAFLAGLLLTESEYRHEVEVNIEPFKGLLIGLFFLSVGMGIDLARILQDPFWIVLSIVGLFVIKAGLLAIIARLFGYRWGQAVEMGLLLGQGGEFAFVIVAMALSFALLPVETAQFMLIVVGGSVFLTPFVANVAGRIGRLFDAEVPQDQTIEIALDLRDHLIIVGFGRTGETLARLLDQQQIPYLALDMDVHRVNEQRQAGVPITLGDASRAATLKKTGLQNAAAMVICTDDPGATEKVLQVARREAPNTPVVARSRDLAHAQELYGLGADRVVPEMLEAGLQLSHATLETVGYPSAAARDLVERERVELENRHT